MVKINFKKVRPLCPKHHELRMCMWQCLYGLSMALFSEIVFFTYVTSGGYSVAIVAVVVGIVSLLFALPHVKTALNHGNKKTHIIDGCDDCHALNHPNIPDHI